MTFGEKIREARKAKNITQSQLAKILSARSNSVSNWENNKSKPDVDTIELLCGVLDIEPNYLLGNEPPPTTSDAMLIGKIANDRQLLDMMEVYYSLDKNDQESVRRIILALSRL